MLLKRGQPPPPSCMLLGGGAGPPPSTAPGANPNNAQVTGTLLQSESGTAPGEAPLSVDRVHGSFEEGEQLICMSGVKSTKSVNYVDSYGYSKDGRGSIKGTLSSKFLMVDGEKVATGSYR